MSDLDQMARNTAHIIAGDCVNQRSPILESHLADVFVRGALWAMTRAGHALAITRIAARNEDAGVLAGVERAQRAIATTHQAMLDASRPNGP